jgi:CRP-like cAMP-binding protein
LNVHSFLERHELFAHFGAAQLAALAEHVEAQRVEADSFVVRQGETTRDAYLLDRGGIRIQRQTPYGQYALGVLGRGDLFGEASFIDGAPRSGDAYTTSRCELLVFRADALAPRLDSDPLLATALHWAFWRSLSAKLRRTNEKIGRFLAETGAPPEAPPELARAPTGEFRIDLRTKRELFSEQRLSPLEINLLATLSREKRFRPGAQIFREGDLGDAMYVVLEGRVRISKQIPGVGEEALGILERGDYFGEMALIDRQPRSADARAHDPDGAVVLAIPKDVVDNLLDIRKVSAVGLLRLLCRLVSKRLREVDDKLVTWYILAGGNVPEIR